MPPAKVRLEMGSMGHPETNVAVLCWALDITWQTLFRQVSPTGKLREDELAGENITLDCFLLLTMLPSEL